MKKYIPGKVLVDVDKYVKYHTEAILNHLELIDCLDINEKAEAHNLLSEVVEYLENVCSSMKEAKQTLEQGAESYERLTGHEMGIKAGKI